MTELYFQARRFVNTYDLIDDKYLIYTEGTGGDTMIKMFCVDPSGNLDERIGLSPVSYTHLIKHLCQP